VSTERMAQEDEGRGLLTRRMLLSAGGITLLAGCSAPAARLAATAHANPAHSKGGGSKRHPASGSAKHTSDHRAIAREPMFYVGDSSKTIALTIDDGPSAIYTPQVLRLLAKYRVTAMFSMIGIEVQSLPGVARDVVAAGHEIANHTWRHRDLGVLAPSAVVSEMDRATGAIHGATGVVPARFRAPYGVWSPTVFRRCAEMNMTPVDWSVDPRDWARPGVPSIVSDIMRTTHKGSIILEHDGGGDRSQTVAALTIVIPRLLAAGYRFRTP
jgi:peptidoglycan-N-acetylglucosamine deacetylase